MRLIDADELKENAYRDSWGIPVIAVEDIDNAPTVEPKEVYMSAKDYNIYLEGYKQGKKDFERPQGEWIEHHDNSLTYHTCSICNNEPLECNDYEYLSKFCPNCGANMRGKENENKIL